MDLNLENVNNMPCRTITHPKTGGEVRSKLWDKLYNEVGDESLADKLYQQTLSPEFLAWFGDWTASDAENVSQIVEDTGEPKLVYHGTAYEFDTFILNKVRGLGSVDANKAFFFTDSQKASKQFAALRAGNIIMPVFLNIKNPETYPEKRFIDWQMSGAINKAKSSGKDGIIATQITEETTKYVPHDQYVALNANQVKSIFNEGGYQGDNIYHQLDPDVEKQYSSQVTDTTPLRQKKTVEQLLDLQRRVTFSGGSYVIDGKKRMQRVSDIVKGSPSISGVEGYYGFDGEESDYADNRAWGDQIDAILSAVILNKSVDEARADVAEVFRTNTEGSTASMSDEVIAKLFNHFTAFKSAYPDSILMTQIALFNESVQVAGTVDVLAIHPDGTISIIDLKSSVKPTNYNAAKNKFEDFETTTADGRPITNNYKKGFPGKASKYEIHQAQQSLYKGLAISKGFEFSDNDLSILPIHLDEVTGTEVTDVTPEAQFPLDASKRFVDMVKKDSQFDIDLDVSKSDQYDIMVDKIIKLLENKRRQLKSQGKTGNANYIKKLEESLEDAENAKVLNKFIDDAFSQFVGSEKYTGDRKIVENLIRKILNKDYDNPTEMINTLMEYKDRADLYNPENNSIMKDLRTLYERERIIQGKDYAEGSPLHKLDQLMQAIETIQNQFQDQVPDLIAEILSEQLSDEASDVNLELLKKINERRKKYEKQGKTKTANRLKQRIIDAGGTILENGEVVVAKPDKELLARELRAGGYKDISMLDRWLTPAISSSNTIVATFAKKVKAVFEDARQKAREFAFGLDDAYQDFMKASGRPRDRVDKFNDGLYEKITVGGKEKMAFVQPIMISKYEKELENYKKVLEEDGIATSSKEWIKKVAEFKKARTEKRPDKDIKIGSAVIIEGIESIVARKKKELSDWEFKQWERRNMSEHDGLTVYRNELAIPKISMYGNQQFSSLIGSNFNTVGTLRTAISNAKSPLFKYYKSLIEGYFEAQQLFPSRFNEFSKFVLPSIAKSSNDRFRENGLKNYFEYETQNAYKLLPEDEDTVGTEAIGGNYKIVPMLYHQYMSPSDVSLDLAASVARFYEAAQRYKAQTELSPLADSTLNLVRHTNPTDTDSFGRKIVDGAAKAMGIDSWVKYKEKHNGNNVAALLESFIDMQIYGKLAEPAKMSIPGVGEVDLGKIADALMGFASKTQIAFNPLLSVANSLQANAMVGVEAAAGEFFTKEEWTEALKEYGRLEAKGEFFSDNWSNGIRRSLIGQLTDLYDPMQGEFRDKFGRNISKSAAKRLWSWDTAFKLQHKGEHHVQITTMIALMKKAKVKQGDKTISLYDAYELDKNEKISLKRGVEAPLLDRNVQNRLHAINKRMHGVYNSFDKPALERYWYGRLIMMYRKFAAPGFKKRYKALGYDHELGGMTEGTYRTFFRALFTETQELLSYLNPLNPKSSEFSDLEKANIRRTATELATIAALGMIVILLKGLKEGADDEEKKLYSYPLYWALRLKTELKFYGLPGDVSKGPLGIVLPGFLDAYRLFRTPTVTTTVIEKVIKLGTQLGDPFEEYQRDTGPYEKGDYKIKARVLKLLGYSGYATNPEEAIKILEMTTN